MSSMAARLSAERPSRNAATRSRLGAGLARFCGTVLRGSALRATVGFFRQRERALVKRTARKAGGGGDFGHCIFERDADKRLSQQRLGVFCARNLGGRRRRNDDDELAAAFARSGALRQRFEVATPDFLMQLGQLAADGGFARAQAGRKVSER